MSRHDPLAQLLYAGAITLAALGAGCTREAPEAVRPAPAATVSNGAAPEPAASKSALPAPSAATPTRADAAAAPAPPTPLVALGSSGPYRVIDLHVDTPWQVHFKGRPPTLPDGPTTPELLARGRYAAVVYPIYIPDYLHDGHPTIADAEAIFATIDAMVAANASLRAASAGPVPADAVAVFVAIEGAGAFADDIGQIERFVARGVRLVGLVHAHDNRLASSATGAADHGLTAAGKELCRRVYDAGALVDASHMSDASFADLVPIARDYEAPIVASHSNARAVADNKRNLSDAQLRLIGESGGVAGLNLYRTFIKAGEPTLDDVVAQVKHMVAVAGVDHVAIGSDLDGGTAVGALEDASRLPLLAEALLAASLSDVEVRKIFAGNALRVLSWRPGISAAVPDAANSARDRAATPTIRR